MLCLAVSAAAEVRAQSDHETGAIRITVADTGGAVLQNARGILAGPHPGQNRVVHANDRGVIEFAGLLDGSLTITVSGRYTLDNVERAHEALEGRGVVGKPVLAIA